MQSPATTKPDKNGAGTASAPAPVRPSRPKMNARPAATVGPTPAPVAAPAVPAPAPRRACDLSAAELDRLITDAQIIEELRNSQFFPMMKRVLATGYGEIKIEIGAVHVAAGVTPGSSLRMRVSQSVSEQHMMQLTLPFIQ